MVTGHAEHGHEHTITGIVDSETISAFEQVPHGIITLRLHDRGLALDLTYEEAAEVAAAMGIVMDHISTRQRQPQP